MTRMIAKNQLLLALSMSVHLMLGACSGNSDEAFDPNQNLPGPVSIPVTPSPSVEITEIIANPSTIRPGQSTTLSANAVTGITATLTYRWYSKDGILSSSTGMTTSWTAPATPGNYGIALDVSNGQRTVRAYLSVVVATSVSEPTITGVLPGEARIGASIRVLGAGFGTSQGGSTITIGGIPSNTIQAWSDGEIRAEVPAGAISGDVVVNIAGTDSNPGHIVVPWQALDPDNVPVSRASGNQIVPQLISDGAGGAIIVWQDHRNGNADIYAQRVDASGKVLWTVDGVAVATAADNQIAPQLVSDGAGGVIVVWQDHRNGNADIYAQRMDASGTVLWTADGVVVATAADNQLAPLLIGDGTGGAIVAWEDRRSGTNYDIYAQRLNTDGIPQWAADGIAVVDDTLDQFSPKLARDATDGVIVIWEDFRNGADYDLYAQRVAGDGNVQWAVNGIPVSTATDNQISPSLSGDGIGGVIVAWHDHRAGNADIYAQRLNADGSIAWGLDGVSVSAATNNQTSPRTVNVGEDNVVVVWEDYRNGHVDIFAQRLDGTGAAQWTVDGVFVNNAALDQIAPQLVSDDAGGVIVAWTHRRDSGTDIFSQRIGTDGSRLWGDEGVVVSGAANTQRSAQMTADGYGGASIVWIDYRDSGADLYIQGITAGGVE